MELSRSLEGLRPVVLYLDGLNAGASSIIVAMGVEADGKKHVLGRRQGLRKHQPAIPTLIFNTDRENPAIEVNVITWPSARSRSFLWKSL
jgi:hypothetical protein